LWFDSLRLSSSESSSGLYSSLSPSDSNENPWGCIPVRGTAQDCRVFLVYHPGRSPLVILYSLYHLLPDELEIWLFRWSIPSDTTRSRPHGQDRNLSLCVNDPEWWKSTPVLQSTECPDEDLSLLVPETYSDTLSVERQLSTSGGLQVLVGFE
jgi:hypothetical protein